MLSRLITRRKNIISNYLLTTLSAIYLNKTYCYSYHQKYRLQGHKDLCRSLGLDSSKLQTSHLAARLNGYLVGVGGRSQFEEEVNKLGLSEKQADYVRHEIERNEGGGLAC